ncbi:MAG: EVE domain-containing protein [Bdellovibrionales bacterium]|nr:EVE domain-containing protein [Bdellovibrionales bacterium]
MKQQTKKYWLMKSEPSTYSIQDLKKSGKDLWDGVRNYQARNFMIKDMQVGDEVLFYHSNSKPPGMAGLACVSKSAQPDPTAFDPKSKYYDPSSTKGNPRWFCVEVKFKSIFKKFIPIEELRREKALSKMLLLKKGQRLSVMPVTKREYMHILKLSNKKGS